MADVADTIEKYLKGTSDITEYVVRGGTINCSLGTLPDVLNMPYSHGVFLKDQPQMNIADSVSGSNIICFGGCTVTKSKCVPSIATKWINMAGTKLKIDGEDALLKNANLICVIGGRITISDSGQSS